MRNTENRFEYKTDNEKYIISKNCKRQIKYKY